ncbi:helix-turn-helix transcriptional regulator [Brevibacterium sp. FAM 25378]|uniref:helix-turn-helix transcriptional regulator n=1 Tax=unclassified Brevibacterium TaxID=2614124 RepID=UPI0010928243|nr:helix-turn-helix transcriptional regulator [Brevibacterium sp. S22]TGD31142.1 transcriptional regulator [Brevibacterium sp. S22]
MSHNQDVREFLMTRRAKVKPEDVGLPAYGGNRRVPGLRREEVAMLAGMSVDYYTRLERGNLAGASEQVLDALSDALNLDEAERAHLGDLARAANNSGSRRRARSRRKPGEHVRPEVQRILDAIIDAPAFIRTERRDILAANELGRALYSPLYESSVSPSTIGGPGEVNVARFTYLDASAKEFFPEWEKTAKDLVASLRTVAGRYPDDSVFHALIGELVTHSDDFARMWSAHEVRQHRTGSKIVHHPVVGELELDYETMELPGDGGQALIVYSTAPETASAESLRLLASWNAAERGTDGDSLTEVALSSLEE